MSLDWSEVAALAQVVAGVGVVASLLLVLAQLRSQGQEQFVSGTSTTFEIWMDDDFQRALQWVLYDLSERTWPAFVAANRGKYGERAFVRVGSYYNRIGYMVTHRLLGREDRLLLDTVAGSAIAVWQKIEPLVLEARLIDNSTLFQDYQLMLPACYECYVPSQPVSGRAMEATAEAARRAVEAEQPGR